MAATAGKLTQPDHFVQFYKADEPLLNRNVGRFLWEGFLRGEGLVVLATAQRRESLVGHLARLGADVNLALREGQLEMHDAHQVLGRLLRHGAPDWKIFEEVIGEVLSAVRIRSSARNICAYGELVGVLWESGQREAAIELEEFWNRLLLRGGLSLFCGYPIDVFSQEFQSEAAGMVLCSHTHLVASGSNGNLEEAIHRAIDEVLGGRAGEVRRQMASAQASKKEAVPDGERAALWLWKHLPGDAGRILSSAQGFFRTSEPSPGSAEAAVFGD